MSVVFDPNIKYSHRGRTNIILINRELKNLVEKPTEKYVIAKGVGFVDVRFHSENSFFPRIRDYLSLGFALKVSLEDLDHPELIPSDEIFGDKEAFFERLRKGLEMYRNQGIFSGIWARIDTWRARNFVSTLYQRPENVTSAGKYLKRELRNNEYAMRFAPIRERLELPLEEKLKEGGNVIAFPIQMGSQNF